VQLPIDGRGCVFCDGPSESSVHLFLSCPSFFPGVVSRVSLAGLGVCDAYGASLAVSGLYGVGMGEES